MTRYLTQKEVIIINTAVIKKYTPKERTGVKDESLLLSALGRPKSSAFLEDAYPDVYSKAAALYSSLSQNHSFHSANKRTGFASMVLFLRLNGVLFVAPEKIAEDYTLYVVEEIPEIEEIAEWIKTHSRPQKS